MNPPPGIEALPNGEWIVAGDSHLGAWSKQHGTIVTDPNLFRWLKPYLGDVGIVWDCGANIGDTARQYCDWGLKVVAIEPNPLVFQCLTHNVPEAACLNIAASDTNGELRFTQLENVGASRITADGDIVVQAKRLDDLNLPYPDFCKIDCEGWEVYVLRGMEKTLKQCKPIIFIEFNPGALAANGHTVADLRGFIESLGYEAKALYPPKATWDGEQFDCLFTPIP